MEAQKSSAECSDKNFCCCWCNLPSSSAHRCQKCQRPCHAIPPCSFAIDEERSGAKVTCFNCWLIFEHAAADANAIVVDSIGNESVGKDFDDDDDDDTPPVLSPQCIDNNQTVHNPQQQDNNSSTSVAVPQKNPRKRRVFTIREKLDILDFAKNASVHAASRQFAVDRSSIQDWKRQETDLRQMLESEKRKRLSGGGRKVCDEKFDAALSNWVRELREKKMRVSRNMIIEQAQVLSTNYKSMRNFTASNGWLERFMHRHKFSLRPTTNSSEQTVPSAITNSGQSDGMRSDVSAVNWGGLLDTLNFH